MRVSQEHAPRRRRSFRRSSFSRFDEHVLAERVANDQAAHADERSELSTYRNLLTVIAEDCRELDCQKSSEVFGRRADCSEIHDRVFEFPEAFRRHSGKAN